ncbi:FHA domain-containing protein [Actinotalea subterranea]|uniref:FHA domain-containing protein n=1 Tax=Actinotalea subterranea TaxID=2607497 RepID=UPI00165D9350|nr:FHA domain-containing protein [Actinotalea subterranea]
MAAADLNRPTPAPDSDGHPATRPQPVIAPPAAAELEDDVEHTRLSSASRRSVPEVQHGGRGSGPRATLQLWDDRRLTLEGVALIGRNPAPRENESTPDHLLAVPDPGRSVSKTHLVLGVDANGVWLQDRNSTNGTVVTLGDGQQILCAPEQKVRVPAQASVAFGDFWLTVVD